MARTILLIGGLETDCDRDDTLRRLASRTGGPDPAWDWAMAERTSGYRPGRHGRFNQVVYGPRLPPETLGVVLLPLLNAGERNRVLRNYPDPPLVPKTVRAADELVDWLVSPDAGLVPRSDWPAEARVAALFCLLAKLLKNRSWANDTHGHFWTQEGDLLGQAPVAANGDIRAEAGPLLEKMKDVLVITKGGSETKKEWAILRTYLPAVMTAFLNRSLSPLRTRPGLAALMSYVDGGTGQTHRLDQIAGIERARNVCRSDRPAGPD